MLNYVIKRLIYMISTLIGMSIISFTIIQLPPSDYLTSMLASMADSGANIDVGQIQRYREIYGLDAPMWEQTGSGSAASCCAAISAIPSSGTGPSATSSGNAPIQR